MPIQLGCECGRRLRLRDDLAGRRIRCPDCDTAIHVPEPVASETVKTAPLSSSARAEAARAKARVRDREPVDFSNDEIIEDFAEEADEFVSRRRELPPVPALTGSKQQKADPDSSRDGGNQLLVLLGVFAFVLFSIGLIVGGGVLIYSLMSDDGPENQAAANQVAGAGNKSPHANPPNRVAAPNKGNAQAPKSSVDQTVTNQRMWVVLSNLRLTRDPRRGDPLDNTYKVRVNYRVVQAPDGQPHDYSLYLTRESVVGSSEFLGHDVTLTRGGSGVIEFAVDLGMMGAHMNKFEAFIGERGNRKFETAMMASGRISQGMAASSSKPPTPPSAAPGARGKLVALSNLRTSSDVPFSTISVDYEVQGNLEPGSRYYLVMSGAGMMGYEADVTMKLRMEKSGTLSMRSTGMSTRRGPMYIEKRSLLGMPPSGFGPRFGGRRDNGNKVVSNRVR